MKETKHKYQQDLDDIMEVLQEVYPERLTMTQLAARTKRHYTAMQRAVTTLHAQERVHIRRDGKTLLVIAHTKSPTTRNEA